MTEDNFNKLEEVYKHAKRIRHELSEIETVLPKLSAFEEILSSKDWVTVTLAAEGQHVTLRNFFPNVEICAIMRANLSEKLHKLTNELNALALP